MTNKTPLLLMDGWRFESYHFGENTYAKSACYVQGQKIEHDFKQSHNAAIIKAMELMRDACKKAIIKDDGCGLHFVLKGCDELEPMNVLKEEGYGL